ncbi:MAG: FIVAR domain-containing protein [Oscillospiraceae bacterium]|nr:FIVAR domain-containing protein [Oscillospiraceae bacterium]
MNMLFSNRIVSNSDSAGKIKKRLASAALALFCMAFQATAVSAASENEIELKANGSEAELELCFPQGAAEEIASMQISVSVRSSSDNVYVEFIPDSGLASKITESRYQSDTGVLNIYLAGTRSLFSDSGALKVGSVKISSDSGNSATAVVGVVQDSFKFVRGGELISTEGEIGYPAAVNLTTSDSPLSYPLSPDTPTLSEQPSDSVPNNTADTYRPSGNVFPVYVATDGELWPTVSVNNDYGHRNDSSSDPNAAEEPYYDTVEPTDQDTIGENLNPPDTSALQDVLSRADGYDQKDYSDNSYGGLNDAVSNANELLADPNATQDEIDDAMLDVENAIGMLTLRNDIPSGAEGYGANNDENTDGGYYNAAYRERTGENGEVLPVGQDGSYFAGGGQQGGQDGDPAKDNSAGLTNSLLFTESDQLSENGSRLITIGLVAIIAAAAAAVIVIKRPKKEKSADGEHFKK